MTLDESGYSYISDSALVKEISDAAYHGADIRPAWIGARRPRTTLDGLTALCHWASVHYDYYLNFVREYMDRRGDVLDIGCGAGQATAMLARYARRAVGIDADHSVVQFADKYNATTGALFVCDQFPGESAGGLFDYIFCIETIEHVPHEKQRRFLESALALLADDGRMFITTPNEQTSSAPHIGIWSREWTDEIAIFLGNRIVRRAYFSNTQPIGFLEESASHHAWVLR